MWLTGNLHDQTLGDRLWSLTRPVAWEDDASRIWAAPRDFRFDKTSSPRIAWSRVPPSRGIGDRAATIHDFMCRCRVLLGLSQAWIDAEFRRTLRADGIGRVLAATKSGVVMIAGQVNPAPGDGVHRKARYNGPVAWRDRRFDSLAEWVREYYAPDGSGLHFWAAQEMGWEK